MTKKPVKVKVKSVRAEGIAALWGALGKLGKQVAAHEKAVQELTLAPWKDPKYPGALGLKWDGNVPVREPEGQFCVIGDRTGHQHPISRTWRDTQEGAEQYAASLMRNQPTTTELLVVKVVSKVGRKEPDIKVTRV